MVESLDVVLLMENNILLFLISEITGQVDFWTEQADHKGRLDIICDEDIVPQWNDHRQFAPQPDIGDNTVKSLQEEYAKLLTEKKTAYAAYRRSRDEMRELLLHKQNVDRMLGKDERSEEKKQEHDRQ